MKSIKNLILSSISSLLLVTTSFGIFAKDINFAWDYSDPKPGIEFELYVTQADSLEWGDPVWVGSTANALVVGLEETLKYRATVRAKSGDLRSPISNILVFTPGYTPETIELPEQVRELRITW